MKYEDGILILGQNYIFCSHNVVYFSVWFLQLTVFKYLVASHVTEPGSLLTEPCAVIKFSHFSSHPDMYAMNYYMVTSWYINGFHINDPLWKESTGQKLIPFRMGQWRGAWCFFIVRISWINELPLRHNSTYVASLTCYQVIKEFINFVFSSFIYFTVFDKRVSETEKFLVQTDSDFCLNNSHYIMPFLLFLFWVI